MHACLRTHTGDGTFYIEGRACPSVSAPLTLSLDASVFQVAHVAMPAKPRHLLVVAATAAIALASPFHLSTRDSAQVELQNLAQRAFDHAGEELNSPEKRSPDGNSCSLRNLNIRREWYDCPFVLRLFRTHLADSTRRNTLSTDERKEYISAVQCITSKPPKTPSEAAPGAKTRFVRTPFTQTMVYELMSSRTIS